MEVSVGVACVDACVLTILQTDRPVSTAVQTQGGLGTYQRSAYRDLVADAVDQINYDRNKNGESFSLELF